MRSFREWLNDLKRSTGGNATALVTIGLPMLIGSGGLAVDVAQWYMWKAELQFAADQAAIAGAWAQTNTHARANFVARARQEYTSNLSTIKSYATTPSVSLANYASGSMNSVQVIGNATRALPFTSVIMDRPVTIRASAQASFDQGLAYTACLIATDTDDSGAITIGGNSTLTAACGIASLSINESSIVVNGNPDVDAGWIISAGGIDDWFNLNTNDEVHENLTNLFDPFAELSPPNNTTPRTYGCTGGAAAATVATSWVKTYTYWLGANQNKATTQVFGYSGAKSAESGSSTANNVAVPWTTVEGSTSTDSPGITAWTGWSAQNGNDRVWERATTVSNYTYTNVVETDAGQASLQPGTYSDFKVKCTTVLASGIYVIDGGGLEIDGQHSVTGAGVMFVLKNGAYVKINGGTSVSLTAMTSTQLVSAGVSSEQASLLSGMLVFEDRNSSGSNQTRLNGNASTVLNGIMYFPVSTVNFAGTATVTSQCLMVAANKIVIEGTANMSTFCPAGTSGSDEVSTAKGTVRLVS